MKVSHKDHTKTILSENTANHRAAARQLEAGGEYAAAIGLYETLIKKYPTDAHLYDRLMILYRKEKLHKKEMALLITAINKFSDLLLPPRRDSSRKITSLSKSILHATGLSDKKGTSLYYPQPIARWQKRKKILQQKMNG